MSDKHAGNTLPAVVLCLIHAVVTVLGSIRFTGVYNSRESFLLILVIQFFSLGCQNSFCISLVHVWFAFLLANSRWWMPRVTQELPLCILY